MVLLLLLTTHRKQTMNYLFALGKDIVDRHTQYLQQEHAKKTYYKIVRPDGTLTGRALVKNGARYKALVAEGATLRRLTRHDKQKMGNAMKYQHAYRSIASPCQGGGCERQYCGYCFLRKNGRCVPRDHKAAQRFLLNTMADKTWDAFKKEKNLAPTKLVCKLLWEEERYMKALAVREKTTETVFAFSEPLFFPMDRKKRVQVPFLVSKTPVSTSLALTVYTAPVVDTRASSSFLWVLVLWVVLMRVVLFRCRSY